MKLLSGKCAIGAPFPVQTRRLRLGIVGGGRISQTQAMAARLTDRWDIVAGALSSDSSKAAALGAQWHLDKERCYSDYTMMAKSESERADGIDAVMITTPNHLHYDAAKAFIKAGIHVICEKPLTNHYSQAEELVSLCHDHNVVFAVCYVMSAFPMIRQARAFIKDGTLGTINQIHAEFMQDWMIPEASADAPHVKWRLDPAQSGPTSCVGDIGTHAAHLAQFVSGLQMTDLRAEFHICGAPKPLEDTAFMMTRFDHKVPGTLMATRLASGNRGGLRLRVFGSKGGLEWDLENCERLKLNIFGQPDQVITRGHDHGISKHIENLVRTGRGFPEGLIEAWGNLYTEFALAIGARMDSITLEEGYLSYPTIEEGAWGIQFIEAAVQSHQKDGRWTAIS